MREGAPSRDAECRLARIAQIVARIDRKVTRQLDAILHHRRFQALEASWRGLRSLVDTEAEYDERLSVRIKVLDISWREVAADVTRALEFDQSHLFRLVYSEEFGTPGGAPFGVLLGDYAVTHRAATGMPAADPEIMAAVSEVATAALCPFVAGADSALLGLDGFGEMDQPADLHALFRQRDYARWRSLRRDEHSRFLALTLPRVLMREPYRDDGTRLDGLAYRENVSRGGDYLWGSACYAFGSVLVRAFANIGWFADIRGGEHEFGEGGVVTHMVYPSFDLDRGARPVRAAAETVIDDDTERELSDCGLIPLCSYPTTRRSVFYGNSTLHSPAPHETEAANRNERLSSMLQYMLCVCRFGHYIKVIGRDRIGSFTNAQDCQRTLQEWLNRYTTVNEAGAAALKARYPLAASRVEVVEQPGRPGYFTCVIHLQPHFQLDRLVSGIRLVTELAIGPGAEA